jgi:hypothetical protein
MIKKLLAKLVSSWDRMPDTGKQRANAERKLAEERHQQIMANREEEGRRKYVSEQTVPPESEILGPSESESKKEK